MYGSAKVSVAEVYNGLRIFVPFGSKVNQAVQTSWTEHAEQPTEGKFKPTVAMGMQQMELKRRAE